MEHPDPLSLVLPAAQNMSTADYVRLLHPLGARGKASGLIRIGEKVHARTWTIDEAPLHAEACLDETAYLSLNRFWGPRSGARLAELNALYLDLDPHLLPPGHTDDPDIWLMLVSLRAEEFGLPSPSVEIATGRGIAAIWLLTPTPAAAVPRWQAAQRALIGLFAGLGADRACCDAARVFRLPGTVNGKTNKRVRVTGGTLDRLDFDELADAIFTAAGRPTRAQLARRRAWRAAKAAGEARHGGLTQAQRFAQIADDLDRIATAWGGRMPEGTRNVWLHLRATCLTHLDPGSDLDALVHAHAMRVTPGLRPDEVAAIARTALRQATPMPGRPGTLEGRYHYAGATIAERLGVSDEMARALDLRQVFSAAERRRRKAVRQRQRRAAAGAVKRAEWLARNDASAGRPWVQAGVSRATWYRRTPEQRAAMTERAEENDA